MMVVGVCAGAALASLARGGGAGVPDYDFEWAVIGDPGNRTPRIDEAPTMPIDFPHGSVGYRYRITKTEVTVGQWWEFVQAYLPYVSDEHRLRTEFLGSGISPRGHGFEIIHDLRAPTVMGFEYAARYVNWLHNDKAMTRDAFESGVYDTSTFTRDADGTFNHQITHEPDARFWIPTVDEWVKAAYWDPNRYGKGEGGYWYFPDGSNTQPISGLPGDGGETNAGTDVPFDTPPMPVGSYPHVRSPWGLLDLSGGVSEKTETPFTEGDAGSRIRYGTSQESHRHEYSDGFDQRGVYGVVFSTSGLRIAAVVPSPGAVGVAAVVALFGLGRGRG